MSRHLYTTDLGQQIILEAELGKGGEGSVWRIQGSPEIVAKIYHHHKRTAAQDAKLRAMLAEPPMQKGPGGHITIAWPQQLLFTHQHCAGFTMARIEQCPDIFQIYNPRLRQTSYPACDRRFLHRTALNLAVAFRLLHARGYVIGDVNQKNILVTADAQVTLIDTDSFQVRDPVGGLVHRCLVATPEYLPRELQGQALDQIDRLPCHDLFGLAVLLFQLLMEGRHPCVGVPRDSSRKAPTEPREWVREGVFPYTHNPYFGPPPAAPDFSLLHPELQSLFLRAFINGNQAPSARPSAKEWYASLKIAEGDLLRCGRNAEHWYYGANGKKCPLCPPEKAKNTQTQQPVTLTKTTKPHLINHIPTKIPIIRIFLILLVTFLFGVLWTYYKDPQKLKPVKNSLIELTHVFSLRPNIEMVYVKGGCYQMGDTFGDGSKDEKPVHEVCVSDFLMGKHEVTQGQWKKIMGHNPSHYYDCGDDCPVENVSWNDVQEFIAKLNSLTGKKYRLPTEAEWEYAARSGGKQEKYSGGNDFDDVAWVKQTRSVGQKQANGLGLYDMSGNVWEWCSDWYASDYYRKSPRENPSGPSSGSRRVSRGGSYYDIRSSRTGSHQTDDSLRASRGGSYYGIASYKRASHRGSQEPGSLESYQGFRIVAPVQ